MNKEFWSGYTLPSRAIIQEAQRIASKYSASEILNVHLIAAVLELKNNLANMLLTSMGVNTSIARARLEPLLGISESKHGGGEERIPIANQVTRVLIQARQVAEEFGESTLGALHILYALVSNADHNMLEVLDPNLVNEELIRARLLHIQKEAQSDLDTGRLRKMKEELRAIQQGS